ncbi:MAG: hypothetical protein FWH04_09305 [Oscillospiraceae bacterium]|nr:hypothetical protein [Oscillospiraceae bacterium]
MKKKVLSLALILVMVLGLMPFPAVADFAPGGYGYTGPTGGKFIAPIEPLALRTKSVPISNRAELEALNKTNLNFDDDHLIKGSYHLTADIDLSGGEWEPINNFCGVFDGQGYVINGLYALDENNTSSGGLFRTVHNATIKNVGINIGALGVSVKYDYGAVDAAGLVVSAGGKTLIENCYTIGNVSAIGAYAATAGGLLGSTYGSTTVRFCYSIGDISATASQEAHAGGLAGETSCEGGGEYWETGTIIMDRCYAVGNISSSSRLACAGGLIGCTELEFLSTISNCFARGNVTASGNYSLVGGLVSQIDRISNSYAVVNLFSDSDPRAIGGIDVWAVNTYWNIDSIQSINGTALTYEEKKRLLVKYAGPKGTHLTTEQMKQQSSFVGFDFNNIWDIDPGVNDGYPFLRPYLPNAPHDHANCCIDYWDADFVVESDGTPEINLIHNDESIHLNGFEPTEFHIGNGKWKAVKNVLDYEKFPKLLNKDLTLTLKDANENIVTFPKINKRPSAPKLAVNYEIAADTSGNTPGQWILTTKAEKGQMPQVVKEGIHIGTPQIEGGKAQKMDIYHDWGYFYPGEANGICIRSLGDKNGKPLVQKTTYFYKEEPRLNEDGSYTPASKPKKITVSGLQKPPKYKLGVNKAKADNTYVNGVLYAKKQEFDLTAGDQVWHGATEKKPATAKQIVA